MILRFDFAGNVQHLVVNNLQHDTTYTVKLRACHRPGNSGLKRCSDFVSNEVRNLKALLNL